MFINIHFIVIVIKTFSADVGYNLSIYIIPNFNMNSIQQYLKLLLIATILVSFFPILFPILG